MQWFKDLIYIIYPEVLVSIGLIVAIILSTTKYKSIIWTTSILFLLTACTHIVKNLFPLTEEVQILSGMLVVDQLSIIFKALILGLAILLILGSIKYSDGFIHKSEFVIVLLTAILGSMFLISSNDTITLFISLETLGLSSIMLAGYSKYDSRSNEASLKYLLNSASASAIFLFGLSLLYGLTGQTQFQEIKYKLFQLSSHHELNHLTISLILMLIIAGLGFKLASAPFHMWSPDVYEGSPTPATAFLSVISKIAGIGITIRLLGTLFDFAHSTWQPMLIIISILSMVIGNFIALGEVLNKASIKRLMAYSSIAQIGYILIGIALFTKETIAGSVFYLIIYSIMNLGAFLCIIAFGNESNSDSITDYSGLAKKKPLLALAFAICLLNLGGLPIPPAGFIAKFILFKVSFEAGSIGILLGTIALITTILSIYYYSYIVKLMIVNNPSQVVLNMDTNKQSLGKSFELNSAITFAVIAIFLSFIVSYPLLKLSNKTISMLPENKNLISYKK